MRRLLAAAVFGASLFAATPAEAFGGTGEGEATYENLQRSDYLFNYKTQAKVYDSPGWLLMTVDADTGWVQKMKLVDCRDTRCIYLTRFADDSDKSVYVYEMICSTKKLRTKPSGKAYWGDWYEMWNEESKVAYNKFCR